MYYNDEEKPPPRPPKRSLLPDRKAPTAPQNTKKSPKPSPRQLASSIPEDEVLVDQPRAPPPPIKPPKRNATSLQKLVGRMRSPRSPTANRPPPRRPPPEPSSGSAKPQQASPRTCCNFVTLKVLFSLALSLGDVLSDFAQGTVLLKSSVPNNHTYGIVTFVIDWLPGIISALHYLTTKRKDPDFLKVLVTSFMILVFAPIVPFANYVVLLVRWNSQGTSRGNDELIKRAEYWSRITHSVSGGIESAGQIILQFWLIVNGRVPRPRESPDKLTISGGPNEVYLGPIIYFSMMFSILSLSKALYEFNVVHIHSEGTRKSHAWLQLVVEFMDMLPFFATATVFRIMSIVMLATYMQKFAILPILIFFVSNLIIGIKRFDFNKIPIMIISVIAIFIPICFTTGRLTARTRPKMICLQYEIFRSQALCSCLIYIAAHAACFYQVNFDDNWIYNSNVILNNLEFNMRVGGLCIVGVLAWILSFKPKWYRLCTSGLEAFEMEKDRRNSTSFEQKKRITVHTIAGAVRNSIRKPKAPSPNTLAPAKPNPGEERGSVIEFEYDRLPTRVAKKTFRRLFGGLIITCIMLSPLIIPHFYLRALRLTPSLIYTDNKESNEMRMIVAMTIKKGNQSPKNGCFREFMSENEDKDCQKDIISVVMWENWPLYKESQVYFNRSIIAIILVSDKLQPSHPRTSLKFPPGMDQDVPVILTEKVDYSFLLKNKDGSGHIEAERLGIIRLSSSVINPNALQGSVKLPEYHCNLSKCQSIPCNLSAKSRLTKITNNGTVFFDGSQKRSVKCQQGNTTCQGWDQKFDNQERDFCDNIELIPMISPAAKGFEAWSPGKIDDKEHAIYFFPCHKTKELVAKVQMNVGNLDQEGHSTLRVCAIKTECVVLQVAEFTTESSCSEYVNEENEKNRLKKS